MSEFHVLLIAGTHGNEINAPWLFEQWSKYPGIINSHGLNISKVIGNPKALKCCKRYISSDLNRSFQNELISNNSIDEYEILRAKELVSTYGLYGISPCHIAIDCHSTTSAMGNSIVVYGRRNADLAIASLLQLRLGLPIYLHEGDKTQKGFLVESWPCGLVVEIGPVPQGLLDISIIQKTMLTLECFIEEIYKIKLGKVHFPKKLIIHRHLRSIDFPRTEDGQITALVHPSLQGSDWLPMSNGTPLFKKLDGSILRYEGNDLPIPVFINEAAYVEKNIAMSLTKREIWDFSNDWKDAIIDLVFNQSFP